MKIELTTEQIKVIVEVLDREIKSNESFIEDREGEEKKCWEMETERFREIKNKLDIVDKQFVLQALTPQQEDFMIEQQIEYARELKNG